MLALSIKENRVSFLSAFYSNSEFLINDFGVLPLKSSSFSEDVIKNILNRKKIKNSNTLSKKCVISIESNEVFLNQIFSSDKINADTMVHWTNNLVFGGAQQDLYNDYHYEIFDSNKMLSVYFDKTKQLDYYSICKKTKLNLSALSIDILSADYVARKMFDAKSIEDYIIWGIGKHKDDMLIIKGNKLIGLVSFKRLKSGIEILKSIGSEKYILNCLDKISNKSFADLASLEFSKKIFMYQKCDSSTDMKNIVKKNKESITILNPLLKIDSYKKKRNDDIKLSFLAEMGYLFKLVKKRSSN